MSDEWITFSCPRNMGDIYGNFMRQVALRATKSWQPIGYYTKKKDYSIGMGSNTNFTMIDFLYGKSEQIAKEVPMSSDIIIEHMVRQGAEFVGKYFKITGLGNINVDAMTVYYNYSSGTNSLEDNVEVLRDASLYEFDDIVFVSSRYSDVGTIKYVIEPFDSETETLKIYGNKRIIMDAIDLAASQLYTFKEE